MKRVIIISGAGLSVESGIKAFRTDTSSGKALWDEYDLGVVCNIDAFNKYESAYRETHEFYNKRRVELITVEPNLAHMRIAEWFNKYPKQIINITTNVDDLLERAGIYHKDILHVHGYLPEVVLQSESGYSKHIFNVGYSAINPDDFVCVKPNVVFFGEMAPLYPKMYDILDNITRQDLVIIVGCSNQVINFNWEIIPKVKELGVKCLVVNPMLSHSDQYCIENLPGMIHYIAGAVETFSDPAFIETVEKHLES